MPAGCILLRVTSPPDPPLVVGRYALYGQIAAGGMATVHFGRMMGAAGFTRTVAVKRLHPHLAEEPEFVSMMIDEARLVARVQHPNVAQTLDVVATGKELLVVMEYVTGEVLSRLLRAESVRQRRVPVPIVSAVMNGVLHGLHAAHEARSDRGVPLGIVHRDVSPQNVMVGVDGVARVIDFGVAKARGRLQTTHEGSLKGKIAYMAPEQLNAQLTTRLADVYSAGVVLWEMLTGRRLFKADDDLALLAKVREGPRDSPSRWVAGIPPELDALAMRAVARNPGARFGTAREMADALVRIVPPALGAEVGAWVEDAAKTVIHQRAAQLSEIRVSRERVVLASRAGRGRRGIRGPDEGHSSSSGGAGAGPGVRRRSAVRGVPAVEYRGRDARERFSSRAAPVASEDVDLRRSDRLARGARRGDARAAHGFGARGFALAIHVERAGPGRCTGRVGVERLGGTGQPFKVGRGSGQSHGEGVTHQSQTRELG